MREFVSCLVLALAVVVMAGCASRQDLRETCLGHKRLYIDGQNPSIDVVNNHLKYCRHAIDANPGDEELVKAYNEMYLRYYNPDGTLK